MVCPSTLLVKKLNIRENSDFWKGYVVKSLIKLKIQSGGWLFTFKYNFLVFIVNFSIKVNDLGVETLGLDLAPTLVYIARGLKTTPS